MAVPRQRKTRSATGQNRSHHALRKIQTALCGNCKSPVMPHVVCNVCGFYRGKQVREIAINK